MKQVTSDKDNIAGPALNRAAAAAYSCARGYAGREQLPALIGRFLTGETSRKWGDNGVVTRDNGVVMGSTRPIAGPVGLPESDEQAEFGEPALVLNPASTEEN